MSTPYESTIHIITLVIWAAFFLYWIVSAIGVKKNVRGSSWGRSFGTHVLLIVAVIFVLQALPFGQFFAYQFGYGAQVVGVILCAVGVAFAIWARHHLGRDWSGTPSMKEGHELVTSGPYSFVRHPIYTGIVLAMLGSVLVSGVAWVAAFVIVTIAFLYRIPIEERYMMQLFPNRYPDYKKRTKALIPFVW